MKKKEKGLKLNRRRIIVLAIAAILLILIVFGLVKLVSGLFGKEKVYGNIANKGFVAVDGSNTYYNKYDTGIVKIKGREEYKISDVSTYCITPYKDKIYFITVNSNVLELVSVEPNGNNYQKVVTLNTSLEKFYIENDYIYYSKTLNDISGIARLSLETNEETLVTAANVKDFAVEKNTIYFVDNVGFLHSVNVNGKDKKDISTEYYIERFQIVDKWIYFYDNNENALCKMKKDGSSKVTVTGFVKNNIFNVTSKYIYYLDSANSQISRCDLKGKKSKAIVSLNINNTCINIANGVLYYLDRTTSENAHGFQMYRVKTNGTASKEIVY